MKRGRFNLLGFNKGFPQLADGMAIWGLGSREGASLDDLFITGRYNNLEVPERLRWWWGWDVSTPYLHFQPSGGSGTHFFLFRSSAHRPNKGRVFCPSLKEALHISHDDNEPFCAALSCPTAPGYSLIYKFTAWFFRPCKCSVVARKEGEKTWTHQLIYALDESINTKNLVFGEH